MAVFLLPTACESRQDSAANLTSPNGSNSISMSVEINGIMYTGRTSRAPRRPWALVSPLTQEPRVAPTPWAGRPEPIGDRSGVVRTASVARCWAHSSCSEGRPLVAFFPWRVALTSSFSTTRVVSRELPRATRRCRGHRAAPLLREGDSQGRRRGGPVASLSPQPPWVTLWGVSAQDLSTR